MKTDADLRAAANRLISARNKAHYEKQNPVSNNPAIRARRRKELVAEAKTAMDEISLILSELPPRSM